MGPTRALAFAAVYRKLAESHTFVQAGPTLRTAGNQAELHARYVNDGSGEGRFKRQLPQPGHFTFLPTTRIPKHHTMVRCPGARRGAAERGARSVRAPAVKSPRNVPSEWCRLSRRP